MLEQVGAQLVDHLVLEALVARAVLRRQPHRVLVGRVHARQRHRAVCIHLARELARQLHRAHLRAEHPSEGALDEVGDRCLDALQQVHCPGSRGRPVQPRRATGLAACYVRRDRAERARPPPARPRGSRRARAPRRARRARTRRRPAAAPSRRGQQPTPSRPPRPAPRASSDDPRQQRPRRRPQRRAEQHPEAQHRTHDMHRGAAQRALPGGPGRRAGRRAEPQAARQQRLGQRQPPVAERAQRRAAQTSVGLPGDRGERAGQAREAEHRRERACHPADAGAPWQRDQRGRGREHDQRDPRTSGEGLPGRQRERRCPATARAAAAGAGRPPVLAGHQPYPGARRAPARGAARARTAGCSGADGASSGTGSSSRRPARRGAAHDGPAGRLRAGLRVHPRAPRAVPCSVPRSAGAADSARSSARESERGTSRRERHRGGSGRRCAVRSRPAWRRAPGSLRSRLVQHERERIEVAGLAGLAPLALLGRHVCQRAEHVARARQHILAGQSRAAEIGQLGPPTRSWTGGRRLSDRARARSAA